MHDQFTIVVSESQIPDAEGALCLVEVVDLGHIGG